MGRRDNGRRREMGKGRKRERKREMEQERDEEKARQTCVSDVIHKCLTRYRGQDRTEQVGTVESKARRGRRGAQRLAIDRWLVASSREIIARPSWTFALRLSRISPSRNIGVRRISTFPNLKSPKLLDRVKSVRSQINEKLYLLSSNDSRTLGVWKRRAEDTSSSFFLSNLFFFWFRQARIMQLMKFSRN